MVPAQVEGSTDAGAPVKGRVLDVNKRDGIVDLSLLARLLAAKKAKATKAPADLVVWPFNAKLHPVLARAQSLCAFGSFKVIPHHCCLHRVCICISEKHNAIWKSVLTAQQNL